MTWSAEFQIDQIGGAGPSPGPNIARIDLWKDIEVHLTPTAAPPGAIFEWSFVSKPPGSLAEFLDPVTHLPNPNHQTPYFIPDVWGTSVVRLIINQGKLPENALVAAVKFSEHGLVLRCGWRYPGFGEQQDYSSDPRGWAGAIEKIFDSICAALSVFIEVGGGVGVAGANQREADPSGKDQKRTRYKSVDHSVFIVDAPIPAAEVVDSKNYLGGILSILRYDRGGVAHYRLGFFDPVGESMVNLWELETICNGELTNPEPVSLAVHGHYVAVVCVEGVIMCDLSMELIVPGCMVDWLP